VPALMKIACMLHVCMHACYMHVNMHVCMLELFNKTCMHTHYKMRVTCMRCQCMHIIHVTCMFTCMRDRK